MKPYQYDDDPTPHNTVRENLEDAILVAIFLVCLAITAILLASMFLR